MLYTMSKWKYYYLRIRFSDHVRLGIYEKISSFIEQGVDIYTCLRMLSDQYRKISKSDFRILILEEWAVSMTAGTTFADVLSDWVPASEAILIKSGEKSGTQHVSMRSAISVTLATKQMKGTLIGKMIYPAVLVLALIGIIYGASVSALPQFASMLPVDRWPDGAHTLYDVGQFVVNNIQTCFLVIIVLGVLISRSLPNTTNMIRPYLDKIPPWSIYRVIQSSSFLIALSSMVGSGMPFTDAMGEIRALSSPYVRHHIDKMINKIMQGAEIGEAMNQGFLSVETGIDVAIYGKLNTLTDVLKVIGDNDIKTNIEIITKVSGLLQNVALVMVAGYMMWLVGSMQSLQTAITASMGG